MRILIDISNSPHVVFFRPIIKELEKRGHNVKIIAREHAQIKELLNLYGLKHKIIGKHAGKNIIKKLLNSFVRVINLANEIEKINPDVCISHQSPYIIYAAFLKGKKRIYIFDNDKAKLQNFPTFPLANKIICPEVIRIKGKKIVKYPGIKEAIYLSSWGGIPKGRNKGKRKKILIRTEISDAAYHKGKSMFDAIKNLPKKYHLIISPRTKQQEQEYKKIRGLKVLESPKDLVDLIQGVDLVVGGGGTMNRESIVLGKPVISTYSGDLLEVDKFLVKKGFMVHSKNIAEDLIDNVLKKGVKKNDFLLDGKRAKEIIIKEIEKLNG